MKALFISVSLIAPLMLGSIAAFAASGAGVTYHGRLVDPAGNPVVGTSVQFRLQIRTPGNENCLMYEEIQSKDMSTSNGVFALTINDGSGARQDGSGFSLDQIFANRSNFTFPGGYCTTGTSYLPNSADGRSLQVYFNDGTFSGWEPVPSQGINFIPMAIESMQVGGYKKENLVKVASGVDTTGFDLTGANFTELMALLNGTSTQFVKPGAATFTAAPQWAGAPAAGNDLVNKTYVDAQVAAGLPNFGTAGTYTKVTTDAKGRVSSGTTLSAADIPALDAAKITTGVLPIANGGTNSSAALVGSKVMVSSGTAIVEGMASNTAKSNNTFVMRDGSGNIAGALGTYDSLSVLLGGTLTLNGATSGSVAIASPTAPTSYTLTLPTTGGTNGYVLSTNGSGVTSWVPLAATTPLSALTAAAATNSIDNLTYGQTWNWSTATTQSPMSITANALTTGSLLNLTTSSASINSTNGLLNVANSTATTTGTLARFQANSTAGSGMTILNSGSVGIGTAAPGVLLDVVSSTAESIARLQSTSDKVRLILDPWPGNSTKRWDIQAQNGNFFLTDAWNAKNPITVEQGAGDNAIYVKSGGNVGIGTTAPSASLHVSPTAAATGTLTAMRVTGAANTNQTLSTEIPDLDINLARTVQWATGALTTQRAVKIQPPTLGFVGASTVTDAATLGITGAPVKGTNATVTNTHGLLISSGAVSTATNSYGLSVNAQSGATNNYAAQFMGGNVGIGTAAPGSPLEVSKTVNSGSSNLVSINVTSTGGSAGTGLGGIDVANTAGGNQYMTRFGIRSSGLQYGILGKTSGDANSTLMSSSGWMTISPAAVSAETLGTSNGVAYSAHSISITSANMAEFMHTASTFTGNGLLMDFGRTYGSGTFTGNFLKFKNGGVDKFVVTSSGSVGVGTATPQATLDVNGFMRLAVNSSAPAACVAGNDGAIALNSSYGICACKGSTTSWIKTTDGTACVW